MKTAAIALLAVATLAACGSADADETAPRTAPTTTTAAVPSYSMTPVDQLVRALHDRGIRGSTADQIINQAEKQCDTMRDDPTYLWDADKQAWTALNGVILSLGRVNSDLAEWTVDKSMQLYCPDVQ